MNHHPRRCFYTVLITVFGMAVLSRFAMAAGAPSMTELANARYTGIEQQTVTLSDGSWEGKPFIEGEALRPRVGLVDGLHLVGDLNGDGADEAVVLLWENSGGSGVFASVAVMARQQGEVVNLATAGIGDRVQIRGGRIAGKTIELDLVQQGPEDAACCPTQLVTRVWTLEKGLKEGAEQIHGNLSLKSLDGSRWRLTSFGQDEPIGDDIELTLAFADEKISGKSACNRYFAGVKQGEVGSEISIGPTAGTRMACAPEVMALESRYLGALAKVTRFQFLVGKLALSWDNNGTPDTLLFAPVDSK